MVHSGKIGSRLFGILFFLFSLCWAVNAEAVDLTGYALEDLLEVTVVSASKFSQNASDAPSAVQVITRDEIRLHGWHTLTEALMTLPGLYAVNDKAYDFLGARGFLIPGDYNTRFLLLIDGQRNNDNIYQQALTGTEGWLDLSMVERIEYIPGPGSAIYGSNAMFGVINVITRKAEEEAQNRVGVFASTPGWSGASAMTSRTAGSTAMVMQISAEHEAGRDAMYADPQGNLFRADGTAAADGIAHGLDRGNNRKALVRLDRGEWGIRLLNHKRTVLPSSALYQTVFDDPSLSIMDEGTQLSATMQHPLSTNSSLFAQLGYTDWSYLGTYPYRDAGYYHNREHAIGRQLNGEFRYQGRSDAHHWLVGAEFAKDLESRQINDYSIAPLPPGAANANINQLTHRRSVFIQDEWQAAQSLLFSFGLRLDDETRSKRTWSPRLGVIWHPHEDWTAKLLSGRAYRSPNAYEKYFSDGLNYLSNPELRAETIDTTEGVVEWRAREGARWQLSLYQNRLDDLIRQVDTGNPGLQYQNGGGIRVHGGELGLEKITAAGLKLRGSLSASRARTVQGAALDNSPERMGKISVVAPAFHQRVSLAAEAQATSLRRHTWNGTPYHTPGYALIHLTATFPDSFARGMQLQLHVANLFNRTVLHPASDETPTPYIPQVGRKWTVKLDYAF